MDAVLATIFLTVGEQFIENMISSKIKLIMPLFYHFKLNPA
jgi:hypothetical protein